ncbi:hypothetical protein [Candidatus Amarobacter glycogenicus]|uniref:hypothetical protein n=1 Tax=Candidatus Amarobacter glycogenicus TaxID=3140699 RepID=UPI002A0C12D1|nr:hypothetical protein [Dehalococcoidia bacterium]
MLRFIQVGHDAHEAHNGTQNANRRGDTSEEFEGGKVPLVAVLHGIGFDLHDLAEEFGIRAVDHELDALAGERVVDLVDVGFQGEKALAPRLVGHGDEEVNGLGRVVPGPAEERFHEELREANHHRHGLGDHHRAERADEDDHEARDVEQGARVAAFEDVAADDPDECESEADNGCEVHQALLRTAPTAILRNSAIRSMMRSGPSAQT